MKFCRDCRYCVAGYKIVGSYRVLPDWTDSRCVNPQYAERSPDFGATGLPPPCLYVRREQKLCGIEALGFEKRPDAPPPPPPVSFWKRWLRLP